MITFINRVTLIGRLGRDPEMKYTQDGQAVCNASMATEKSWKKDDEWKKAVTWHKIVAWQKLAEALGQATKGDRVFIEGEIKQRSWENKEGVKQYVTEVQAGVVEVLGKGPMKSTEGNGDLQPGIDDDSVPF